MSEGIGTIPRAFGLKEGEGDARWWLGVSLATIKVTGKETGGRYTLVEVLEPDGGEAPPHVHHNEDEAFWVLEGELTFEVGDRVIVASAGSFLFGPKNVPLHRQRGPCAAAVRPLARGLRGVYLRDQRAGEGAYPAAPAGWTAR